MGLIHGADSSGNALPLLVDSSGRVIVAQTDAAQLAIGSHGWDGSAWRKNPLSLGYSGRIFRYVFDTALPAGNPSINDTAVPAGEIWNIKQVNIIYIGTVPTEIRIRAWITASGTGMVLLQQQAPVSNQWYVGLCDAILIPGDFLQGSVTGATLNDDFYMKGMGYRILIAE